MKRPFSLILGGSEKNADFTELASFLTSLPLLKRVAFIGDTANRLEQLLLEARSLCAYEHIPSLDAAFADALQIGEGGVTFSPACASLDYLRITKLEVKRLII